MATVCCRLLLGLAQRRSWAIIPARLNHTIEKEPMKATVTFLGENQKGGQKIPPYIKGYSSRGFRIKDMKVVGSVAIVPDGFYHWKVQNPIDITPESLSLFTIMEPPIEILVVGTGDGIVRLSPEVQKHMKKQNIMLEVQSTRNASATLNILLEEQRLVGAVLIPPQDQ